MVKVSAWGHSTYRIQLDPIKTKLCTLSIFNYPKYLLASYKHNQLFNEETATTHTASTYAQVYKILSNNREYTSSTFTFCLNPNGTVHLCRTANKGQDNKCKHLWLCNQARNVCSSGSIQFLKNKIFIDNLSGTYKPTVKHLTLMKRILQHNFPSIAVYTIHPSDVEMYCKHMKGAVDHASICKNHRAITAKKRQPSAAKRRRKTHKR